MLLSPLLVVGLIAPPVADEPAVIRGRVTDAADAPLAGVRVRVAVPDADMRFVDPTTGHKQAEARTDARGRYRVEIPGVTEATSASIDAMKPGYRRLSGTMGIGGNARVVQVGPGQEAEADLRLEPALYVAGIVLDERGQPVPGVKISSNLRSDRATAGLESTTSNPDGAFELFNFPADSKARFGETARGRIDFPHPDRIAARFEDVYALDPEQRKGLRIILDAGHRLSGTVLDEAGEPVAGATVKVTSQDGEQTKGALTDKSGKFTLRGLKDGLATLKARALGIKQKVELFTPVREDKDDLVVRLSKIPLPADIKGYDVLGIRLADVTPELKAAYDLYHDKGALILDPGKDSARLDIGDLAEGYMFWIVGENRIGGVKEFVDQILAETAGKEAEQHSVRVVFSFSTVEVEGNNTQYLKLTKDDLKQLQPVSDRLTAEGR